MSSLKVMVSNNLLPIELGNIPKIMKGESGSINSINVITLESSESAAVGTSGDPSNLDITLSIPKGDKGDGGSFLEKSYKTYAEMELDKPNLTANISTRVSNDSDTTKNGSYTYDGTVFTRSLYDSKAVTDKIISDTAIAVQDAINNTAIEGGVLADTFVTVTAEGVDTVARTQRDKNSDRVSVKDFGAKGDGETNDTASIQKAALSGRAIYFPSGEYPMDAAEYEIYGSSIDFFGNGDATIILRNVADGRGAFKLGDNSSASIEGINVTTKYSGWLRLFVKNPNQSVDDITVHKCKFYGKAMLFYLEGNALVSPLVDFCGVNKITITQSLFQDMYTIPVHLFDCPVRNFQFERNKSYNFLTGLVYLGIGNSNPYATDIKNSTWKVSVKYNEFINDDNTYARAGTTYHCCLLVECENVYWEGNYVEGLKSLLADTVVYDAYLTATNIVHKNNMIKNICAFHPNARYKVLIKGKSSANSLLRTKKIVEGNTYTIEKDWVTRVGQGNAAEHYLYQLNDTTSGGGDTVIKSNVFNIQGYLQFYDGNYDNLSFTDNEIIAEYFSTNSSRKCFFNALPTSDVGFVGSMHIKRNKWKFGTLNNLGISVYEQTTGVMQYWKYVDISDNTFESLEANKPISKTAMFNAYKADETLFTNNTFINTTFDTALRNAEMGVFTAKNNNFSNDYYLLSGLGHFELMTKTLWARGIKAPVNVDLNILAKYNEKLLPFYLPVVASDWGLEDNTIAVGGYTLKVDMASLLIPSSTLLDFKFSVKNKDGVLTLRFLEYVAAVGEVPASTSAKDIVLNDSSFDTAVVVASSTLPNTKIGTLMVGADGVYFEPNTRTRTICNLDIKLKIDKFPSTHTGI